MNEFEQALGAFKAKELNLAQFRQELGSLLFTNASVSDTIMQRLEEEHRLGHLSSESHRALMRDVKKSISENHPTVLDFSIAGDTEEAGSAFTAPVTETLTESAANDGGAHDEGVPAATPPAIKTRRELRSGDTLNNRFVLEATIKRGGMGTVFKAMDKRRVELDARQVYVAIKALNLELSLHPDALRALQHEAFKSQALSHPNIVNVFDFDRDGDIAFIAMEFLEGETLASLLRRLKPDVLPKDRAMSLIRDMGAALAYSHERGILHADFKPSNVFVTKAGTAKLLDFGVARALDTQREPGTQNEEFDPGRLGGKTPAYATREMLDGSDPDPRDDVYALACVAYQLLCGSHPYRELSAKEAKEKGLRAKRIKALSRSHWRGLARGLALDRAHRTSSVTRFLADIGRRQSASTVGVLWRAGGVAALLLVAGSVAYDAAKRDDVAVSESAVLTESEPSAVSSDDVRPVTAELDLSGDTQRAVVFRPEEAFIENGGASAVPAAVADFQDASALLEPEAEAPGTVSALTPGPGVLAFASSSYSVSESRGVVQLVVERREGMQGAVSLQWRTVDGTAHADEDYGSFDWTALEIEPEIPSYSLFIPIVSDLKVESDEIFRVEIAQPEGGAVLGTPAETVVTIVDDDPELDVSADDQQGGERP